MDHGRRFRGIFGMALTWGVGLSALATGALALGLATGVVPSEFFGAREIIAVSVRGLLLGGVAGGLFGWLIARREHGNTLATLSTKRVATWGFVAAASIPTILAVTAPGHVLHQFVLVASTIGYGAIGGVLGAATLGIARRETARLNGAECETGQLTP